MFQQFISPFYLLVPQVPLTQHSETGFSLSLKLLFLLTEWKNLFWSVSSNQKPGVILHPSFTSLLTGVLSYGLHLLRTTWITTGGDGIPVELFQILKDDAVKVLHSICQQIWKTQQWPQDWKRSVLEKVSFHSNPKERQCQRMVKLLHNCAHLTH